MLSPAATAALEESTAEVRKPRGAAVRGSHRMKTEVGRRKTTGAGLEESRPLAPVCGWSRPPEVEGMVAGYTLWPARASGCMGQTGAETPAGRGREAILTLAAAVKLV